MKVETVIFQCLKYRRYPESNRRRDRVYFSRTDRGTCAYLHREIWKHHFGEIPKGFHIHHKDGNTINNDISNLELVQSSNHLSKHSLEFHQNNRAQSLHHVARLRELAKAWHRSEEGRSWHREHAKRVAAQMPSVKKTCQQCGKQYEAKLNMKSRSKFCHQNCKARALRARRKINNASDL